MQPLKDTDARMPEAYLPSDISEQRLRGEVQALLVSTDLTAVTLGQLRRELETRLGLSDGALASRTSLQRWVAGIIQHEVVKKGQRSGYCERVAKAIIEIDDYPGEARQMLIESLPHAIPQAGKPLHTHQAQFLSIARDALGGAKRQAAQAVTNFSERTRPEEAELSAVVAERAAAAGRETAALGASEAAASLLRDAEKEVWLATLQLQKAEEAVRGAHEDVQRAEQAQRDATALRDGRFSELLDGTLGEDAREAGIAEVVGFLQRGGGPPSLAAAAPVALRRRPEARSAFERVIADAVTSSLAENISEAKARLAAQPELMLTLGESVAAAKTSVESAQARVAEQEAARDGARAGWEAAVAELRAAEVAVSEKQNAAQPRLAEEDRLAKKVQEIDSIVEVLDGLMASGPKTDPGFTSPRKVATPMRTPSQGLADPPLAEAAHPHA
mmetsp:Transcript_129980/g.404305  ORF Transcript_129980/g.404305 Transcript_129980/m.404305 type:complete len:445 (+) Transcript_129980:55-1389(+)